MFEEALKAGINPNIAESREKIPALATAIENDRKSMVNSLFNAGAHPQYLVHKAFISKVGFTRVFNFMVQNESDLDVRGVDPYEGTLLHHACEARDFDAVRKILSVPKVNVNIRNGDGDTPLLCAIKSNNSTIAEMLIKAGADVNIMDKKHNFPIHLALYRGQKDLVVLLERHGCDVNVLDELGYSPLHIAVMKGMACTAIFLTKQGANVKTKTADGELAIHIALRKGTKMKPVSTVLVYYGSPFDVPDKTGNTAYHQAIFNEFWDIALYMSAIDHSRSYSANKAGETPLLLACRKGKKQLVFQFLDSGADPNRANSNGSTPLYEFIRTYKFDVEEECLTPYNLRVCVEKFIFKNADFKLATSDTAFTALHAAVKNGLLTAVDIFIQLDGDVVNLTTSSGDTPLHIACATPCGGEETNFNLAIASLLLGVGARTDITNANGDTPLHVAVKYSQKSCVGLLLNFHAELYHWDKQGKCPLHCAVEKGYLDVVDEFLEVGTNLNVWTENGRTPLSLAVVRNQLAIVKKLVSNGANLTIRLPDSHNTALHTAVEQGKVEIVKELIKGEVNVHMSVNKRGETPIMICEKMIRENGEGQYSEMLEILKEAPLTIPVKRNSTLRRRALRSQQQKNNSVQSLTVGNPLVKRLSDANAYSSQADEILRNHYESNVKGRHEVIREEQNKNQKYHQQVLAEEAKLVHQRRNSEGLTKQLPTDVETNTYSENSKFRSLRPVRKTDGVSAADPISEDNIATLETWLSQHGVTGSVREKIIKDSKTLTSLRKNVEEFVSTVRVCEQKSTPPPSNVNFSKAYANIRNVLVIAARLEKLLSNPSGAQIAVEMVTNIETMIRVSNNRRLCQQASYPAFTQKALDLVRTNISHPQFKFWSGLGITWNSATG